MSEDKESARVAKAFIEQVGKYQYSYHWLWMGRPILQLPQDIVALQMLIMRIKPDFIVETGVAHGGGAVFYASMLKLLDFCEEGDGIPREVAAIDIELRPHNRSALEKHPLGKMITVLDGSSTDSGIVGRVKEMAQKHKTVLVVLDSYHSHSHVYKELESYGALVTPESYMVVCDTILEDVGELRDKPWGTGDNPYTAVEQYLKEHTEFIRDTTYDEISLLTACPGGWLQKVR
jgi:cephalosporin hydroxylase